MRCSIPISQESSLTGTEIKSIREGKARITESFCEFNEKGGTIRDQYVY